MESTRFRQYLEQAPAALLLLVSLFFTSTTSAGTYDYHWYSTYGYPTYCHTPSLNATATCWGSEVGVGILGYKSYTVNSCTPSADPVNINSVCSYDWEVYSGGTGTVDRTFKRNADGSDTPYEWTDPDAPLEHNGLSVPLEFSGVPPDSICEGGTWHNISGDGIVLSDGLGNNIANYMDTGASCTPDDTGFDPPADPGLCLTGSNGTELCLYADATNCGYFNGIYGCAEDIPPTGNCTLLGGGGFICNGDSPPLNQDATAPEKIGEISQDTDSDGTVETGEVFTQGTIGQVPPQELKIDETGTPVGTDDMYNGELDGLETFVQDIGNEGSGGGVADGSWLDGLIPDFGLPGSGSCTSQSYNWHGQTFSFPGTRGCVYLSYFKALTGWLIYAYTVFVLLDVVTVGMRSKI